jgi:hypothetical protein
MKKKIFGTILAVLMPALIFAATQYFPDIIVKGSPWYDIRGYSTLGAAVTAVGASGKTMLVLGNVAVSSSTDISAVPLWFLGSGKFTVATGQALTVGSITAGTHTIFAGAGTIVPTNYAVKAECFGITMLAATECEVEVGTNQAITANMGNPATMSLSFVGAGRLTISNAITFTALGPINAVPNRQIFFGNGAFIPPAEQPSYSDWWPSFAKAVADIAANVRSLYVLSAKTVSGNVTVPTNIKIAILDNGQLNPAGGVTIVLNTAETYLGKTRAGVDAAIVAGVKSIELVGDITLAAAWDLSAFTGRFSTNGHQISGAFTFTAPADFVGSDNCFGSTLTVTFTTPPPVVYADWWGTDCAAIQSALNSIPRGVVELGNRSYAMTDDTRIVWPLSTSANELKTIHLRGQGNSRAFSAVSAVTGGNTILDCSGLTTGAAIDLTGAGDDSFTGAISGINLYGPGAATATTGISTYKISKSEFRDVGIHAFGVGFSLANYAYYSKLERVYCRSNGIGLQQTGGLWNQCKIEGCMFSSSTTIGFDRTNIQSSDSISFNNCYFEANGTYGFYTTGYFEKISFSDTYFELNGTADIYATSMNLKSGTLTLIDNCFDAGGTRHAVASSYLGQIVSIGNKYKSYGADNYIFTASTSTKLISIGDNNLTTKPFIVTTRDLFSLGTTKLPSIHFDAALPNYGHYAVGHVAFDTSISVAGGRVGWIAVSPGAGGTLTELSGYTGTISSGSNELTLPAGSVSAILPGMTLQIDNSGSPLTFSTGARAYATVLKNDSGILYLDGTADADVTAGDVTYKRVTWAPIYSLANTPSEGMIQRFSSGGAFVAVDLWTSGTGAPSANADFIGQEYLDTAADKWYKAKTTGTGGSDWLILN